LGVFMPKHMLVSPGRTIVFTILLTIVLGTVLLSLPCATRSAVSLLDLAFTATSVTCVTGLMTVPLQTFTPIGQFIIVCLMQIGALGLVTLTVFLVSLFVELGLTTQLMAGKVLELESWKASRHIIAFIIGLTLAMECLGTMCVYQSIKASYPTGQAIFYAFFHAVSSFSNAGLTPLADHVTGALPHSASLLLITALLVMIGGLGFIVWYEILSYMRAWSTKKHFHWTLHSKVVLSMTAILIAVTTTFIFGLEFLHMSQESWLWRIGQAFFNAICCRSTGFTTLDITVVHLATLFSL
jgi:Trk-type K+ transport systems, membrane components